MKTQKPAITADNGLHWKTSSVVFQVTLFGDIAHCHWYRSLCTDTGVWAFLVSL